MTESLNLDEKRRLAHACFLNNDFEHALEHYRELCELDSTDAQSWNMAGAIHGIQGRFIEAEYCCRHAVTLQPSSHAAHLNIGNALMALGRYPDAQNHFEQAAGLNPNDEHIYNNLGTLMVKQARPEKAYEYYRKALKINPGFAETHNNMGALLRETGNPGDAIPHLRRALDLNPRYLDAWINLGGALLDTANNDEAEGCYKNALAIYPGHPGALSGIGTLLERSGKLDEAYAVIRPLIEQGTDNPNVYILFSKLSRHLDREQYAVEQLERLLTGSLPDSGMKAQLCFALGDLLDRMGRYEEAFAYYRNGNSLVGRKFSLADHQESIDCLIDKYSESFLANAPHSSIDSSCLVFIVGMPRSGTSLVEQILSSHPGVYGLGEVDHIPGIIESLRERLGNITPNYPAFMDLASKDLLDELAARHIDKVMSESKNSERVIDKTMTNYLTLGLIELIFPDAHIIHCKRNPLDVCLSCYFQQFSATHAYTYDLEDLGGYYLEYERIMAHWKRVLDIRMMEINYYELVTDYEQVVRSMIETIGLDWHPDCMEFHLSKRQVMTASYNQVTQPIYSSSIDRWKNYEVNIAPLAKILDAAGMSDSTN